MKIYQWEVWKACPPGFTKDHWFVIISGQGRCDQPRQLYVNGLACFTLRGPLRKTEVLLNSADGFAAPTAVQWTTFTHWRKPRFIPAMAS